jgi:hypothetical protein
VDQGRRFDRRLADRQRFEGPRGRRLHGVPAPSVDLTERFPGIDPTPDLRSEDDTDGAIDLLTLAHPTGAERAARHPGGLRVDDSQNAGAIGEERLDHARTRKDRGRVLGQARIAALRFDRPGEPFGCGPTVKGLRGAGIADLTRRVREHGSLDLLRREGLAFAFRGDRLSWVPRGQLEDPLFSRFVVS